MLHAWESDRIDTYNWLMTSGGYVMDNAVKTLSELCCHSAALALMRAPFHDSRYKVANVLSISVSLWKCDWSKGYLKYTRNVILIRSC